MMITRKPKIILFALIAVGIIITVTILCTFTGVTSSVKAEIATVTDKETLKDTLLRKLKTAVSEGSIIKAFYMDDFNKDNRLQVFGLINNGKENTEGSFDYEVWYADESGIKKLFEGGIYSDTAKIWDVGKQKLFYVEEGYGGSGSLSHVWSVREGVPYELKHAGELLEYAGNLNFYTYPGEFDLKPDGTGHTWKRYYLYFDEATSAFKEYGGILISKEDFLELKGASRIYDEIIKNGYKVSDIFYRENGIIHINYNNLEYNLNVNLIVQNREVAIEDFDSIENPDYDQGGSYKAAIFEDIASYPKNFNSVLTSSPTKDQSASNQLEANLPKSLEEAVRIAVKNSAQNDKKGEFIAEGHIIFASEQNADIVKAYLVSSYTNFCFENNIFTAAERNGFAAVITCEINENGEYQIINFEISGGGNDYIIFIEKKFHENIWNKALPKKSYYPENLWEKVFEEKGYNIYFEKQKKIQAEQYLKSINSDASIDMDGFME